MVHMKLDVLVNVCMIIYIYTYHVIVGGRDPYRTGGWGKTGYITHYILLEEGTRIARADGGRRGISIIIYYWRKGPVLHGRSAKTVLLYLYV